ncbi:uncharacterized protein LOC107404096 [Ziziphus jujuba]|uniref:Uncharacterized protein LOC107404096 n=1 Tax=Ziziphus jujuba TaxID=326968 RepID=A0ABM3IXH3_ZIZJJ|nr:uncharacterized protein LOC107404096 [Ziziphus jujuba]
MEIQNSNHEHPLVLKGVDVSRKGNYCKANECCREIDIHSAYYVCEKCNYYLHYLCAEPSFQQFNYLFHRHPLTLQLGRYYRPISCRLCRVPYERKDCYSCKTCNVNLHIECALKTPTITLESKQNVDGGQHLCHNKEMELVEIKHGKGEADKYSCRICELPLLSSSCITTHQAYSCRICKNFFHRYCIESSPEITHPFHPSHSLKFTFFIHKNTGGGKCRSCCKTYPNRFFFYCGPCKIYICAGCIFSKEPPSFKYQGHDHLLHLIEKIPDVTDDVDCAASRAYCKQMVAVNELTNLQQYVFRCIDCKFDLHFLCGPLPCSISHRFHIHPLVLFDRIVEDDSGEYYCDVCENQRDPRFVFTIVQSASMLLMSTA